MSREGACDSTMRPMVEFLFPSPHEGAPVFDFTGLDEHKVRVRLSGSMKDVDGETHEVEDEIDAGAWSSIIEQSGQLYVQDAERRLGDELEKIRKTLSAKRGGFDGQAP